MVYNINETIPLNNKNVNIYEVIWNLRSLYICSWTFSRLSECPDVISQVFALWKITGLPQTLAGGRPLPILGHGYFMFYLFMVFIFSHFLYIIWEICFIFPGVLSKSKFRPKFSPRSSVWVVRSKGSMEPLSCGSMRRSEGFFEFLDTLFISSIKQYKTYLTLALFFWWFDVICYFPIFSYFFNHHLGLFQVS